MMRGALVVWSVFICMRDVDAVACSQDSIRQQNQLIAVNKALFQACLSDLNLSSLNDAAFISEEYLQSVKADAICASNYCVQALITAMETFPDCCTSSSSVARNLPRMADEILYQCDLRDAKQLAQELQAEIKKLEDLKVQIKNEKDAHSNSIPHSQDMIIDLKQRELKNEGIPVTSQSARITYSSWEVALFTLIMSRILF